MKMAGQRFQVEASASAKALGQEHACQRKAIVARAREVVEHPLYLIRQIRWCLLGHGRDVRFDPEREGVTFE